MSKRKRYRSSEWPGLVEQWSRSGESAERFSSRLGISAATLARWGKQTRSSALSAPVASSSAQVDQVQSLFTPVQVVRPTRAEGGLIEVVTRSGCVVRVHGAVSEETLASVFAAVGGC